MSHFYAQIDSQNIVIAVSGLSGEIKESHPMYDAMIPIHNYDTSLLQHQTDTEIVTNKCVGKDDDGYGIFEENREPIPEPIDPEPTQDEVNAAVLLNQMDIMTKQEEQDAVLAEILLNGLGV